MILSILICTVPERSAIFNELYSRLTLLLTEGCEILYDDRPRKEASTGAKRQRLLERASGDYVVFIDDDDWVPDYYFTEMVEACKSGCDCVGMHGYMTTNGANRIDWEISKDFQNRTIRLAGKEFYQRKTNHITAVKREIALKVGFPDKSNAEDKYYSEGVTRLCQTEYKINKLMYHYRFSTKNKLYV